MTFMTFMAIAMGSPIQIAKTHSQLIDCSWETVLQRGVSWGNPLSLGLNPTVLGGPNPLSRQTQKMKADLDSTVETKREVAVGQKYVPKMESW